MVQRNPFQMARPTTTPTASRATSDVKDSPLGMTAWGSAKNSRPSTTPCGPPTLVLNGGKSIGTAANPRSSTTPPARLQRKILDQLQEDVKLTLLFPWEKMRGSPMHSISEGSMIPGSSAIGSAAPVVHGPKRPLPFLRAPVKEAAMAFKEAAIGGSKLALPPKAVRAGEAQQVDSVALHAELSKQMLGELKRRARRDGVDEEVVQEADDDDDPKAFIIEHILQKTSERRKMQASAKARPPEKIGISQPLADSRVWQLGAEAPAFSTCDEAMLCNPVGIFDLDDRCETQGFFDRELSDGSKQERELAAYQHAKALKNRAERTSICNYDAECACGFVFKADSDAKFCQRCGRCRGISTAKGETCNCGAHLSEEAHFCSKCGESRSGIECPSEAFSSESSIRTEPERPSSEARKEDDEEELLMEHMTQNEALDQMLSPHYVLIGAEKDVMVSAVALARMEAKQAKQDEANYVQVEGQMSGKKRKSFIPSSTGHSEALLSFVPKTLRRSIKHGLVHLDQWKVLLESPVKSSYEPVLSRFRAALVFADASGFTKLTEALARQPQGAEKIGTTLNGFFCPVIELVEKYGGDIIKFSGDALSIVWASEEPAPGNVGSTTLNDTKALEGSDNDTEAMDEEAVAQAARFCIELQAKIPSFGHTPVPGCSLTMHIGVGFGKLALMQVGGLLGRWEYCIAGGALDQISIAEPLAASGETVFSPEAIEKAYKHFNFDGIDAPLTPGFAKLRGCKVASCSTEQETTIVEPTFSPRVKMGPVSPGSVPTDFLLPEDFPPWWRSNLTGVDARLVKRCVPSAVALRLASSPEAERVTYPEEMRRVSVIFVSIVGLDPSSVNELPGDPRRIGQGRQTQLLMRLMQRSVYALEGSVNKFLVDDKGVLLLVAFGLPPLIHFTDDPIRAVLCAMRIGDTLRDEGLQGRIGVATGQCWCGVIGNTQRREYTVMGDVVNLSARLMGQASVNSMCVDETTMEAGQKILDFESVGDVMLKGKVNPVRVFKFIEPKKGLSRHRKELRMSLLSWNGWPAQTKLLAALDNHMHKSGVIFITGPGGAGKTELAEQVKTFADKNNWNLLSGQNMDPTGTFALPRLCLQEVFRELVHLASKEKYWRTRGWHLLLDSLQDDPEPEINAMRNNLRNRPRTGVATATEIYWILIAMIRETCTTHEAADLEPWAPILSLVVTQLAFGPRMVSAMLERDEQHARNDRFAELCTAAINGYSQWDGNNNKGTMILLHVRRSSAFFQNRDPQEAAVFRAIAELCMRRRAEESGQSETRPLVLCIVSRESVLKDGYVMEKARECGGLVEAADFSLQETFNYVQHMFDSIAGKQPEANVDQMTRLPSENIRQRISVKDNGQIKASHRRRMSNSLGSTWDVAQLNGFQAASDAGSRRGSHLGISRISSNGSLCAPSSTRSRASVEVVSEDGIDDDCVSDSLPELPELLVPAPTVSRRPSQFGVPGVSEIIVTKMSSLIAEDAMHVIAEYVYEMTGGNGLGVEVMLLALERRGVLKPKDGHLDFAEPYMDAEYLRTSSQLPEKLVGMAFGAFERLDPQAQSALKAATTLDRVFTRVELDAALSGFNTTTRESLINKLIDPESGMLVRVETPSGPKLRFYSGLLRFAASSLVLKTQRDEVRRKTLATLDAITMDEKLKQLREDLQRQSSSENQHSQEEDNRSSVESDEEEDGEERLSRDGVQTESSVPAMEKRN